MSTEDFITLLKMCLLGQASRQETEVLMALAETDEELAGLYREICQERKKGKDALETEQAWANHRNRMKLLKLL